MDLLKKCGIKFTRSRDQLFCASDNFPIDLMFLRDDDIPELVNAGACDLGIVGLNVFEEQTVGQVPSLTKIMDLGFGKCRLSLAGPKDMMFNTLEDLQGKTIATSYPRILSAFLTDHNIKASIVTMNGAIEVAPRLRIADVVCDLVSTGQTLAANGLREIHPILKSQSILIRRLTAMDAEKETLLNRLQERLRGVQKAEESKYIMLHCPINALERVKNAIPGAESPTVLPLQGIPDKVAVHAVCNEGLFWNTMEQLKQEGATSILVLSIEKMLD
jgi:ATP phosphoribosyltransferase